MNDRLMTRTEVEQMVGLKRSAIYARIAERRFPIPLKVGRRGVRWREPVRSLTKTPLRIASHPTSTC